VISGIGGAVFRIVCFPRRLGHARFRFASRLKLATVVAGLLAFVFLALPSPALSGVRRAVASRGGTRSTRSAVGNLWPTFGHDPAHSGVSSDTGVTASAAPGLTEGWSASLGANAQSSPAIAHRTNLAETLVYDVTTTGVVSAFNATSGAPVWQQSVGAVYGSSPAVYKGTLYVGTMSGTLEALDADTGAVQCTFTVPVIPPATSPGRLISSPVVGNVDGTGPTVFIGDAGIQPAGDPDDIVNGGHFWAITGVGNTAGGCQEKWMYDAWPNKGNGDQTGVWDEPALARNSLGSWEVVFGTANPDRSVYALNAASGSLLWRFQTQYKGRDEDVGAGPTIGLPGTNGFADGVVYIDGKDGIEYALDLLTGKNLTTGKPIWQYTLGDGTRKSNAVSEAALSGNTLVVCYGTTIYAFNAATGAVIWQATAGARVQASPAVSGPPGNQVVFVGDISGTEYGFNLDTGAQVFAAVTSGKLQASAVVAGGVLYFSNGHTLYTYGPS
jgi:outer membrane protein assembly factor BamB